MTWTCKDVTQPLRTRSTRDEKISSAQKTKWRLSTVKTGCSSKAQHPSPRFAAIIRCEHKSRRVSTETRLPESNHEEIYSYTELSLTLNKKRRSKDFQSDSMLKMKDENASLQQTLTSVLAICRIKRLPGVKFLKWIKVILLLLRMFGNESA